MITYQSLLFLVKDLNFFGYEFHTLYRMSEYDSVEIVFKNNDKYFKIHLSQYFIRSLSSEQLIDHIHSMVNNSPDFRKLAHNQQFYNKFDKMLNE